MALFNKWGSLGVVNRALLERSFDDLANAAAWQLERGDWKGARSIAEKLLSLETISLSSPDAQTGEERIELSLGADGVPGLGQLSSKAVNFVMERGGKEPAAASKLARVWLEKLPTYIAGPATREEKLRVAELSQLLGTAVFALDAGRLQTIALAVDAVRGSYGPGALAVLPQFVSAVEEAKRERVARQVETFSHPGEGGARPASPGATTPAAPTAPTVQPPAEQPAPKPVERPLVSALDFTLRSMLNAKKARLSSFKGKTVILYFWDLSTENRDVPPSPAELLFALSKQYDPAKVALLLVHQGEMNSNLLQRWQRAIDPNPALDQGRGHPARIYPREIYLLDQQGQQERALAERVFESYGGSKNAWNNPKRVIVINPSGQAVGYVEFKIDAAATKFNSDQHTGGTENVYDFDKNALEDLIVRAAGPQS